MSSFFSVPPMLFELGRIVATRGVAETCSVDYLTECLLRHARGDWGRVSSADSAVNDRAIFTGLRLMSVYPIDPGKPCIGYGDNCLWIITEGNRSATTFLLSSEY